MGIKFNFCDFGGRLMSSNALPDGRRLDDLKVSDLKKELEIRGLSRSGVKKDLYARLNKALKNTYKCKQVLILLCRICL